jgi:hypothetical protein
VTAETRLEAELASLLGIHLSDAGGEGFEESEGALDGIDVVVVFVALLFRPMERLLVGILLGREEALL